MNGPCSICTGDAFDRCDFCDRKYCVGHLIEIYEPIQGSEFRWLTLECHRCAGVPAPELRDEEVSCA